MKKYIYTLIGVISAFSVHGQNIEEKIIGTWIFKTYNLDSGISYYEPARKLIKKANGFCFKENGSVTVRMNSSGCAVIDKNGKSYVYLSDVEGTWEVKRGNCIRVKFESFIGVHEDEITIVDDKLKVEKIE